MGALTSLSGDLCSFRITSECIQYSFSCGLIFIPIQSVKYLYVRHYRISVIIRGELVVRLFRSVGSRTVLEV